VLTVELIGLQNLAKTRANAFSRQSNVTHTESERPLDEEHGINASGHEGRRHKPRGFFADQFEASFSHFSHLHYTLTLLLKNTSNYEAHFRGTGPEIWQQTGGEVNAFVSGAGRWPSWRDVW
jgi:cysteine synthase A